MSSGFVGGLPMPAETHEGQDPKYGIAVAMPVRGVVFFTTVVDSAAEKK
jgi:hypothetical protein